MTTIYEPLEIDEEVVLMAVERVCRNCVHFKSRRGKPYCIIVKQTISETNICRKFKSKQD